MRLKEKLMIGATAASLLGSASADILNLVGNGNGTTFPDPQIEHKEGATESTGIYDSLYNYTSTQIIDFYSVVAGEHLFLDARPYESLTTVNLKIEGRGLSSSKSVNIAPNIVVLNNAFSNKNIYSDLYSITNGVRANLIRTDNIKLLSLTNGTIPLTVSNSYCFDLDIRFVPMNNAPMASNSTSLGGRIGPRNGNFSVSDSDGSITNVALVNPSNTNLVVNGTNWTYYPKGVPSTNNYSFFATDNLGARSTTNVLSLVETNALPVAGNKTLGAYEGRSSYLSLDKLLSACYDNDDSTLNVASIGTPSHGSAVITNGAVKYTPASGYSGSDSFSYNVSDPYNGNGIGMINVNVSPITQSPNIIGISREGITNTVRYAGVPNYDYALAFSSNPNGPFSNITTNKTPLDGINNVKHVTTNNSGFYRAEWIQSE